jgi:integrase
MTKLSPTTLTRSDQMAPLEVVQDRPREALLVSLALGTGLRLAEIVGLMSKTRTETNQSGN